jgi:hypothetical protein
MSTPTSGRTTAKGTRPAVTKGRAPVNARKAPTMFVLLEDIDETIPEQVVKVGGLRMVIEVERRFGAWGKSIEHMAWAVFVALGKPGTDHASEDVAYEEFIDRVAGITPCDEHGVPLKPADDDDLEDGPTPT